MKNASASKIEFPTAEEFEQKKAECCQILRWEEVPTEVIHRTEKVRQITTKLGSVTIVATLIDEDGASFKAFHTGCLENDLRDFGWGEEWFIKSLGK